MIVTDKEYFIDDKFLKILDLMVKRIKGTDDVMLPIDGDEGQGKTEIAIGTCYYMAYKTKRKYDVDNIFFDLDEVIAFASSTKKQIIHYDEGALGLLRTQWQKKSQQKFLQLAMIARKKKHFMVICIPKFHRLPPYVAEDRAIGMIHVYSHKNIHKGRFCYYKKASLENLYKDYQRSKSKNYKVHYNFRGRFVEASKKIFTKEQLKEYDDKKDQAILNFGEDKDFTPRQQGWLNQRNALLGILKSELKLTNLELSRRLREEHGLELSKNMIQEIIQKPKDLAPRPL